MARTGRPSKLTAELVAEVDRLLKVVIYEETVCDALGLDRVTFYRWKKRGERESEGPYHDFCNVVKKAKAEAEIGIISAIRMGVDGWQARAWIAERAFRDHWGRQDRLDVTVRREAERLAEELGLDARDILAEAERLTSRR